MIGALIGAGLSVASSIAGNIAARRQRQKARDLLKEQLQDTQNWRDRNYYQDATKRGDTIRLLAQMRETMRERSKAARGRQAVMGGTESSVDAVREANNKTLSSVTGDLVAANEARKDRVDTQAETIKRQLKGQQAEMSMQDAENTAKTVQQVAGVAGHIANGLDGTGRTSGGAVGGPLSPVAGQEEVNELERIIGNTYKED